MPRKIKILLLAAAVIMAAVMAGCSSGSSVLPGNAAPEFQLKRLDGQPVALSELKGRPVMLNFWATWCNPCRVEMPHIQGVYENPAFAGEGLVILAVNVGESAARAGEFMEASGLTFTVLLDEDESVARAYNLRGLPTTFFIDEDGIIRDIKAGTFTSRAEIEWRLINSIIAPVQEGD